jgi:hypothetical protein
MTEADFALVQGARPDPPSLAGRVKLDGSPLAHLASVSFCVVNGRSESSDVHVG